MPTTKSIFMTRLKELRLINGLSQADLAAHIHLSAPTINRYECGIREPDLGTLTALADFFGVDFNYLLGGSNCLVPQNENDMILMQKFHALDNRGKATVINTLEYEYSLISQE